MFVSSPELDLILILTEDIYQKTKIPFPEKVNWESFIKLASRNKMLYHATKRLLEDKRVTLEPEVAEYILHLKEVEEAVFPAFHRTLELVSASLGDEPYLLSKTYRVFPYVTHDVDLVVKDMTRVKELFIKSGLNYQPMANPKALWFPDEAGLLEIEVYQRIMPGPMVFMDDSLPWSGSREMVVESVKTRLPSVEAEILNFLAEMGFRLYELLIGDMLHIYKVAPQANWKLMAEQARKYEWLEQFHNGVAVLNSFHRQLYREPSPMEEYFPTVTQAKLDLPYVTPLPQVARALMRKGLINLVKLPAYYSVRLKKYPRLHRFYIKVVMDYPEKLLMKYIYH